MHEIVMPTPANLASESAEQLVLDRHLDQFGEITDEEQRVIIRLERLAENFAMTSQSYFVSSGRSMMVPKRFDADDLSVPYINFGEGLDFQGEFVTYAAVRIGRISRGAAVRALCLAFDGAILLPYFDRVPEDHILYTPVLAVQDMDRVN